jgi:hypothetical protein
VHQRHADALKQFQRAREIAVRLTVQSPDNATWRTDLEWVEKQIAVQQKF